MSDVSRCSNRVLEKYKCFGFLSEQSRCHIFEILLFMTLFIVIIPLLLEILEVFVYLPETLEPQSQMKLTAFNSCHVERIFDHLRRYHFRFSEKTRQQLTFYHLISCQIKICVVDFDVSSIFVRMADYTFDLIVNMELSHFFELIKNLQIFLHLFRLDWEFVSNADSSWLGVYIVFSSLIF